MVNRKHFTNNHKNEKVYKEKIIQKKAIGGLEVNYSEKAIKI